MATNFAHRLLQLNVAIPHSPEAIYVRSVCLNWLFDTYRRRRRAKVNIDMEVMFLAAALFDRYLSIDPKSHLPILKACLMIAAKLAGNDDGEHWRAVYAFIPRDECTTLYPLEREVFLHLWRNNACSIWTAHTWGCMQSEFTNWDALMMQIVHFPNKNPCDQVIDAASAATP